MTQANMVARPGRLNVPRHLRGTSLFSHGTPLTILEDPAPSDPQRMKVRIGSKELTLERRYVEEDSLRR